MGSSLRRSIEPIESLAVSSEVETEQCWYLLVSLSLLSALLYPSVSQKYHVSFLGLQNIRQNNTLDVSFGHVTNRIFSFCVTT